MSAEPADPFPPTADPDAYVPRSATERALAALEDGYRSGQRLQVLSGPPGHGKTLIARVLAKRLGGDFRSLYLPYASLPWEEFGTWVLGLFGGDARAGSHGLRDLVEQASEKPLLLLVDEANSMPEETAGRLDELLADAAGRLRLLLITAEEPPPHRVLARMVSGAVELRLNAPLSAEETQRYVDARLARAGAPAPLRETFDREMSRRLHRASKGIPAELHRFATEVLRGNTGAVNRAAEEAEGEAPSADAADVFGHESGAPPPEVTLQVEEAPSIVLPPPARLPPPAEGAPSIQLPPPAGESAPELPLGSPFDIARPEPPSLLWIVSVNLAIAAAMFGLLWVTGYIPPSH